MKPFEVKVNIPQKRIVDLFISACEGGSNYWCEKLTPKGRHKDPYDAMLAGFTLKDGETGCEYIIGPDAIQLALERFPVEAPTQFGDFLAENDDASTGDCFLQLCVFGKVVYG